MLKLRGNSKYKNLGGSVKSIEDILEWHEGEIFLEDVFLKSHYFQWLQMKKFIYEGIN